MTGWGPGWFDDWLDSGDLRGDEILREELARDEQCDQEQGKKYPTAATGVGTPGIPLPVPDEELDR